jgi:hypothetical protein
LSFFVVDNSLVCLCARLLKAGLEVDSLPLCLRDNNEIPPTKKINNMSQVTHEVYRGSKDGKPVLGALTTTIQPTEVSVKITHTLAFAAQTYTSFRARLFWDMKVLELFAKLEAR